MRKKDPKIFPFVNKFTTERLFTYIDEIMNEKELKSEEEFNEFMESIRNAPLESLKKKVPDSPRLRAQELIYKAAESSTAKGKKLVLKALEIYPDCADAYNYLGDCSENPEEALEFYRKAIEAGERDLGEKCFKEDVGHFWGITRTRPYIRAKFSYAQMLALLENIDEAIAVYQDILRLNPNDNMGSRFELAPLLLEKKYFKAYYDLYKAYEDDVSFGWLYNYVLYLYIKIGAVKKTQEILRKAISYNPYVIDYMVGIKEMPDELPGQYLIGSEEEALLYVNSAIIAWMKYPRALYWIGDFWERHRNLD